MDETVAPVESRFEQHRILAQDGLGLSVRDYAPATPASLLPVVCLHGLNRNARDFERVAPALARLGRRVIVPDLRGRGQSDWDSNVGNYSPRIYVRDTLTIMDALAIERAVFIGTSLGGIVMMLLALKAKGRIAAAVLNDIAPLPDAGGMDKTKAKVFPDTFPDLESALATRRGGDPFPDRQDAFWRTYILRGARLQEDGSLRSDFDPRVMRTLTEAKPVDMTPLFRELADAGPLLLVRGEISALVTPDCVTHMRAVDPDLTVADVPRTGHAPTLEEPEAWNAITAFLARVP